MNIMWGKKEANLINLEHLLDSMHPETDLLVLPEMFSTGFPTGMRKEEVYSLAEDINGSTMERLADLASRYNIGIVGSLIIKDFDALVNRVFFIEPSKEIFYEDKAHLFRMGGENEIFKKGKDRLHFRFRGWNIDTVVCYDLRFPVWCRNKSNEYDLLIVVANWPTVRDEVWQTLLKARAIENLSYVCGVNCKGRDFMENEYSGSSFVFNYKGKDISIYGENGLKYALLDMKKLQSFHEKFPVWKDADKFFIQ